MKRSPARLALPLPVRRALVELGIDLATARKRRGLTMEALAERVFVTRQTIARVERGDDGVSIGIYATVLFVLGLADRLATLVEPAADRLGMDLAAEALPKRVRPRKA